jgi:hypothetical protein
VHRDEILEQLDISRVRLLELIESLPDEALLEPGTSGSWSIADILAHLTAWESELVTALLRIDQGKIPARFLAAIADVEAYNARRYQENEGRELDRIFDDFQSVRFQLELWLEEFSARDLTDPKRYSWAEGKPLWSFIEDNSFGHESEHMPGIEALVSRRQGTT